MNTECPICKLDGAYSLLKSGKCSRCGYVENGKHDKSKDMYK